MIATTPPDPHARGCTREGQRPSSTFDNRDFCPTCQRFVAREPAHQLRLEEAS